MKLLIAQAGHHAAVAALLQAADLTTEDLDSALTGFVVLLDGERVVAAGGLQMLGTDASTGGLIRSVVVDPAMQGQGLGKRIYQRLEQDARDRGLADLYLLTETAEAYFARLGYTLIARDSAPAELQAVPQFAWLCPASAVVMHTRL
jgi:amino-acid N-acetyltransferase